MPVRKKKSEESESVRTSSGGRKVSVVLPADLAERVQRLADVRGERLTKTVVGLIEAGERQAHEGIREDALSSLRTELLELVGQMGSQVRKEVQGQAHRLSHLLVRTSLETMATRETTAHALYKLYGNDRETVQGHVNSSWKSAVDRLKNPSAGVRETLNLVIEGAGQQEPGALLGLAEAARDVQQSLRVIQDLAGRVEALESRGAATQGSVGELTKQLRSMTATVSQALVKLNEAEEDFRSRPKTIWGSGR